MEHGGKSVKNISNTIFCVKQLTIYSEIIRQAIVVNMF
jgi:hypothetical protein